MPGPVEIVLPQPSQVLNDEAYHIGDNIFDHYGNNVNIAVVPNRPDVLLRWYPHNVASRYNLIEAFGNQPAAVQLLELKQQHERHISRLREVGIAVVRHVAEIVHIDAPQHNGLAWVAIVEKLENPQPLTYTGKQAPMLPKRLLEYVNRTIEEDDPLVLSDIYFPGQYVSDEDRIGVLLDVEPRFRRLISPSDVAISQLRCEDWIEITEDLNNAERF
jgi:hypothetical protein